MADPTDENENRNVDWQEEHNRRVAQFPDDIGNAHKHSSHHREEILASGRCGCFYCCSIFLPEAVVDWTDEGTTALCPVCGIDSVIGDKSGYEISVEFLEEMKAHWF